MVLAHLIIVFAQLTRKVSSSHATAKKLSLLVIARHVTGAIRPTIFRIITAASISQIITAKSPEPVTSNSLS